ncbi:Bone morphogenetic protein 1 [Orchesella cincta]|uniref:Bone morphogenetic protein 1 n=1 Tax=Orchesella cincta TaxID=48709 RepID=A0A1D2M5B3_ORCCI|nr:Bone morphogenetic protein 1 [Orchesella cincta]
MGRAIKPACTPQPTTTHIANCNGLIRYPVEGEYEPNRVTTWLVKTSTSNPDLELDVVVQGVDIEECENTENPCLCDALILYEISPIGVLRENLRLCGSSQDDVVVSGLPPNFILAFFTDYIDVPGVGTGFEVIYRPSSNGTRTSTTTEEPTTPSPSTTTEPSSSTTTRPPPSSNYTTQCGGLLSGVSGLSLMKPSRNERCIWTVRTPYRARIKFNMIEPTTNDPDNNVRIYMVYSNGNLHEYTFPMHRPSEVTLNGTMAWVLFQSNSTGNGFAFNFTAEPQYDNSILAYEDRNTVVNDGDPAFHKFPEGDGLYRNLEMSSLVFMRPTSMPESQVEVTITSLQTQRGERGECFDVIHVYRLLDYNSEDVFNPGAHITKLTPDAGVCEVLPSYPYYMKAHGILILFSSDAQGRSEGMQLYANLV